MTTYITGQMAVLYQMLSEPNYEQTLDGVTYYYCKQAYMIYRVDGATGRSKQIKYKMVAQHQHQQDLSLGAKVINDDGSEHLIDTFMCTDEDGYHVVDRRYVYIKQAETKEWEDSLKS
jgi:hypothetical protein